MTYVFDYNALALEKAPAAENQDFNHGLEWA